MPGPPEQVEPAIQAEPPAQADPSVPHHAQGEPGSRSLSPSPSNDEEKRPWANLDRSWYILYLTLLYSAMALFAWTVTCVLTFRPITFYSYGLNEEHYSRHLPYFDGSYQGNERWYQSARVVQAIVAVLTIPLTSAVCSKAAVVYTQERARTGGISLRQTMALADRGWTDISVYWRILCGGMQRYGTKFLAVTVALNILGGILSPLQSVLLSVKTIKVTTNHYTYDRSVAEIVQVMNSQSTLYGDRNRVPILTRAAITSASLYDPQSRLWTRDSSNCTTTAYGGTKSFSFMELSTLCDPFFAPLPLGYSTGVVRQFLPRINSTASRQSIPEADFPDACADEPNSFFFHADSGPGSSLTTTNWSITVCMPGNQSESPWKPVYSRQDFTEIIYLNISASGWLSRNNNVPTSPPEYFRITVNTTAGYFELPNYMNGFQPGPLLQGDYVNACGIDCISQNRKGHSSKARRSTSRSINSGITRNNHAAPKNTTTFSDGHVVITNSSMALEVISTRGPLLTTAIALFGNGSFIANRLAEPDAFIRPRLATDAGACLEGAPLAGLMLNSSRESSWNSSASFLYPCIINDVLEYDDLQMQLGQFVTLFNTGDDDTIQNAFSAAAYLANEVLLTSTETELSSLFTVASDPGVDLQIPSISMAGLIAVSILLGLYLLALLALSIYGSRKPTWTYQLDTLAMLRIGAAVSDDISFKLVSDQDKLRLLDDLPGWIGDESTEDDELGRLGLGAAQPLNEKRRYELMVDKEKKVQ